MPPRSHLCALSQRPRMPVQVQFLELVAVSLFGSNWFSRVPMFRRFKFLLDVSDCRDTTRSVFGRLASQLKAHRTSFYSTLYFTCHTMPPLPSHSASQMEEEYRNWRGEGDVQSREGRLGDAHGPSSSAQRSKESTWRLEAQGPWKHRRGCSGCGRMRGGTLVVHVLWLACRAS